MGQQDTGSSVSAEQQTNTDGGGLDFGAIARQFWKARKILLLTGLGAAFVCSVVVILLPSEYTAKSSFLPPNSSSTSSLASQLGALGSVGLMSSVKTPGDVYGGILQSSSVLGKLVDRFNLMSVYGVKKRSMALTKLAKRTTVDIGLKDTIVTVTVMDHDANRARDLANAYLDELQDVSTRLAVTEGAERRRFYEERLLSEKNALANAEVELKKSEESTGLIVPSSQAQAHFESITSLRSLITNREARLAAMLQTSTEQNMDVIQLRSEIDNLKGQLNRLQQGGSAGDELSTKKVPEASLEYVRKQREVRYHETMFELLARQYETARLDEAKEGPSPQILDRASTPDLKSGPPRALMVAAAFLLGVFGAAAYTLLGKRKTLHHATQGLSVILLLIALAAKPALAYQQPGPLSAEDDAYGSTNVPMDSWVYPALERLANLGYIDNQSVSIRPWTRAECHRQMKEAESYFVIDTVRDPELPEAERLLSDLRREFETSPSIPAAEVESIYTRVGTIAGPALTDGFHFGQTWWNDYGRPLGRGSSAIAGYSLRAHRGRFFFYDRQELQYGPGKAAVTQTMSDLFQQIDMYAYTSSIPNAFPLTPASPAGTRLRPIELYAGVAFDGTQLSFGKQQLFWGPTKSGPFSFSSNAEPTYNLRLVSTRPHYIPLLPHAITYRYDLVFGKLSGHKFPARPYFNGQKLEFTIAKSLELSVTRWSLLWGVGHPMTLGSLKNNFFSSSSTGSILYGTRDDPGDRKSGFDFRWHLPGIERYVTLYADGYADDELNPLDAPRRVAWSPGIYFSQMPYLRNVDLRLEVASSIEMSQDECCNRFFINDQYRDANTNKGFLLGNAVGRDARSYEATSTFWRSARTSYSAMFRHVQGGRMLPGSESITDLSFTGNFALSREWSLTAFGQYERWLIPVLQSQAQHNASSWISLTWNPHSEKSLVRRK